MANPDSSNLKATLRKSMRQLLRGLNADPTPVCVALEEWLATRPGTRTVAAFAALPGEVDLAQWVRKHPEIRWVYPRVVGNELRFHRVNPAETPLMPGIFGVLEPSPALPEVEVAEIDVFLCPGLAFDAAGGRLGRGKGFYDRVLARSRPDACKIGVCFPTQRVLDTHCEAHDVRMDRIISG